MRLLVTGGSSFIGTHVVDYFCNKGWEIVNIDTASPKKKCHARYWIRCDILDVKQLRNVFRDFKPTHLVHLAARTDTLGKSLDDYKVNTIGTYNVLTTAMEAKTLERAIITSTSLYVAPEKSRSMSLTLPPIPFMAKAKRKRKG